MRVYSVWGTMNESSPCHEGLLRLGHPDWVRPRDPSMSAALLALLACGEWIIFVPEGGHWPRGWDPCTPVEDSRPAGAEDRIARLSPRIPIAALCVIRWARPLAHPQSFSRSARSRADSALPLHTTFRERDNRLLLLLFR